MENVSISKRKRSKLETVLDFVERQRDLQRQDKREKKRKAKAEQERRKAILKKYGWLYVVGMIALFGVVIVMAILEGKGII